MSAEVRSQTSEVRGQDGERSADSDWRLTVCGPRFAAPAGRPVVGDDAVVWVSGKANLAARRGRWLSELADGVENDSELDVVLLLQFIQPVGEAGVLGQHPTQAHESTHYYGEH